MTTNTKSTTISDATVADFCKLNTHTHTDNSMLSCFSIKLSKV